jgi:hypothetical protein
MKIELSGIEFVRSPVRDALFDPFFGGWYDLVEPVPCVIKGELDVGGRSFLNQPAQIVGVGEQDVMIEVEFGMERPWFGPGRYLYADMQDLTLEADND